MLPLEVAVMVTTIWEGDGVMVVSTEETDFVCEVLLLVEDVLLAGAGAESSLLDVDEEPEVVGVAGACVGLLDGEAEAEVSEGAEVVGFVEGVDDAVVGLDGGVDDDELVDSVVSAEVVGEVVGVDADFVGLVVLSPVTAPTAPDTTAEASSACRTNTARSNNPACAMAKNIANIDNNFNCRECILIVIDRYRSWVAMRKKRRTEP
jgi:hypothetical protein